MAETYYCAENRRTATHWPQDLSDARLRFRFRWECNRSSLAAFTWTVDSFISFRALRGECVGETAPTVTVRMSLFHQCEARWHFGKTREVNNIYLKISQWTVLHLLFLSVCQKPITPVWHHKAQWYIFQPSLILPHTKYPDKAVIYILIIPSFHPFLYPLPPSLRFVGICCHGAKARLYPGQIASSFENPLSHSTVRTWTLRTQAPDPGYSDNHCTTAPLTIIIPFSYGY